MKTRFRKSPINMAILLAHIAVAPRGVLAVRADADPDKLLAEVKSELQRIQDEVKGTAEKALKESKNAGELSAETKKTVDELLIVQNKLSEGAKSLEEKLEALNSRNMELEQKIVSRQPGGDKIVTAGMEVISSDELKNFVKNRGCKGSIKIDVKDSLRVMNAITSTEAAGVIWPHQERSVVEIARRVMTIRSLIPSIPVTTSPIEYSKQTVRTNNANVVGENPESNKPESAYEWEKAEVPVRTIAHWVPASQQAMNDSGQLQGLIDTELRYGLELKEEQQLLAGTGLNNQLTGLLSEASDYSAAFEVTNEQYIDVLRLMILQVALAEYPADGIVLHPTDWAKIELLKDGEQRYLFANATAATGPRLWGLPVVPTQSMTLNNALVGAFSMAATIYDREGATVLISSEDRDNFVKNMLTVLAEKRLALAVKRPTALVTGELDSSS